MAKIENCLKTAGACVVTEVVAVAVFSIAPVVSLIAIPIFALKALSHFVEHRSLYHRTLTNGSRAKFGRVEEEDYTRWNGKAVVQIDTNPQDRMHELNDVYIHGLGNFPSTPATDSPFQNVAGKEWLK